MRLIDADEYERELITVDGDEDTVYNAICVLDKMPTVKPNGHWIKLYACDSDEARGLTDTFECDSCGAVLSTHNYSNECCYDYCPYCGSKNEVSE